MKQKAYRSLLLAVLTGTSFLNGIALAQESRGRVQGYVTDSSRAAVVGASVVLRNVNTGVQSLQQSNSTGFYLFDHVIPGKYSVTVEAAGFARFQQQNITVMTGGDVTVNAPLTVGAVSSTVTVSANVADVQFNSASMTTEVIGQQLRDLPVADRNPFSLVMLNPAVQNRYTNLAAYNPYDMWDHTAFDVGGVTQNYVGIELDGTPLNVQARGSYAPSMDALQEVNVEQNPVDAQNGFSAGVVMNMSMKSGTNDWHGTADYFGRNPLTNALANRITRSKNVVRQNQWGATLGNAIIKNKLFNFFSYEGQHQDQASTTVSTVPTAAERTGDFSRTLTPKGNLSVIYDPFTTQFNPATSSATRQPFPGNIIPQNRINPSGQKMVSDLWMPNNPGNDISGINNFQTTYPVWAHYWNFADRVDYNIGDKWRLFSRFSKYQTRLDNANWGGTIAVPSTSGGFMDALNAAMDVLYMATPSTTVDLRYGVTYVEDDYGSTWAQVPESTWAGLFPSGWYKPILASQAAIYYPTIYYSGNGSATAGAPKGWLVHERSHNPEVNVTHDHGIHHIKAGWQMRYSYDHNIPYASASYFNFNAQDTGSTFLGFNPAQSGNMYASALLGVASGQANFLPVLNLQQQQHALYFQDDVKLSRSITLNLGMRWEYETAPADDNRLLNRYMDLNAPLPALASNPPTMPAQVTSIANIAYQWKGDLLFTDNAHPRMYDANQHVFLPRLGIAIRLNDKTAFRAGWARNAAPLIGAHAEGGSLPTYGASQTTNSLSELEGVPQTLISDPFPASNPLLIPFGTANGIYTQVGNSASWWNPNVQNPIADRLNFTLQRQVSPHLFTEATFFMDLERNLVSMYSSYNLNQIDPNLVLTYKGQTTQTVPNPFYGLPASEMPGNLRLQKTIAVSSLLHPYPQYGNLNELGWAGATDNYYGLQLKAERRMASGLTWQVGYNYSRELMSTYFNAIDTYNNNYSMIDRGWPRHNVRVAATWDLPFGTGRRLLGSADRVVNAIVGGWSTSYIFMWNSGQLLSFGQADVTCDPRMDVPQGRYFNNACFNQAPAYTLRTNPMNYPGLRGPMFWNLDATLAKTIPVTERVSVQLRGEFYNMPNVLMWGNPSAAVGSGIMGRSTAMANGNYGRQFQYSARIQF